MKNKIVYNKNYGGYGLNETIIKLYKAYCDLYNLKDDENKSIPRHHPALVKAVEMYLEQYPKDTDLAIYETEDTSYKIDNYDGLETVVTKEQQEWINIIPNEFNKENKND